MKNVAIVMPYFNEVDLLRKSFEAVCKQTYKNWHLYIIDDGSYSTRRAYEVIGLQPNDTYKKISWVYKPNGGVSSARNMALAMIKANNTYDYVAYCDSDDIWNEDYLEQQVKALMLLGEIFKCADMVYCTPQHRFLDGSVAIPYGIADYPEFPGLDLLLKGNCIYISGVVHKVVCLDVGFFDPDLNSIEDWDYWVRICKAGYKIFKNPNTTFVYTVKPDGNGAKGNKEVYDKFYKKHS